VKEKQQNTIKFEKASFSVPIDQRFLEDEEGWDDFLGNVNGGRNGGKDLYYFIAHSMKAINGVFESTSSVTAQS